MNNSNRIKEYVSHFSAARLWNIPYLDDVLGAGNDNDPLEITVLKPSLNYMRKNRIVHLSRMALPPGAVARRGDSIVASPEMIFLQLAKKLDIRRLILLGLQMCSYSPGQPAEGISTKRKLRSFWERSPGFDGHVKAARALNYIENGSASIMESMTFMMLSLPYKLGGYGLNGAIFSQEIALNAENRKQLKQNKCYVDIYYPAIKTAIEYDSFKYHSKPKEQSKDSLRALALKRQGIEVIDLKTTQLYDKKLFEQFAQNLATRLRKRLRNKSATFDVAHQQLRRLLPSRYNMISSDMI